MLKYWNLIRKDKKVPDFQQVNPHTIEDIWTQCFVVNVDTHHNVTYKYEYMGPSITQAYGQDLTGQEVDYRIKKFPGIIMFKKLGEVTNENRPMEDNGYFVSEGGKLIKYRACFLPFGNDVKGLTHIVVGLSFKLF